MIADTERQIRELETATPKRRKTLVKSRRSLELDPIAVALTAQQKAERSGITFIPQWARELGLTPAQCHAALERAADAGVIELRPESGLGRLSRDDFEFCLPGPRGSKLSWMRVLV